MRSRLNFFIPHIADVMFQILNEASTFLNSLTLKVDDSNNQNINMNNNLWTPKKVSSIPYKKTDEGKCFAYTTDYLNFVDAVIETICISLMALFRSLRIVSQS